MRRSQRRHAQPASPRERVLAAMEEGLDSGFPVVPPYLNILLRDRWSELTDQPWWALALGGPERVVAVYRDLLRRVSIDWVQLLTAPPRSAREGARVGGDIVVLGSGRVIRRPRAGGERSSLKGVGLPDEELVKSVVVRRKWEILESGKLDFAGAVVRELGGGYFTLAKVSSPLWAAIVHVGFPRALHLYRRPGVLGGSRRGC